jgi:hypothetical protein
MTTNPQDHRDPMPAVQAHYRSNGYGRWAVILPELCPSGEHLLAHGYNAEESDGLLRVTCTQHLPTDKQVATWLLVTGGRQADHAEFDSRPYTAAMPSTPPPTPTRSVP